MSDFILCATLAFLAGFVLGAYSREGNSLESSQSKLIFYKRWLFPVTMKLSEVKGFPPPRLLLDWCAAELRLVSGEGIDCGLVLSAWDVATRKRYDCENLAIKRIGNMMETKNDNTGI